MFMGHLGVPTKKLVKGNEGLYFISAFCVAPAMLIILFTSPAGLLGCYMLSDNSFSCFRRKAFYKSDLVDRFTTSVALIHYIECVF